jgi:WXG100 family type VII secretion target
MAEKIRVNYPALEEMARKCREAAARLRQTAALGNQTAQQFQNGAMVGEFGERFCEALQIFQGKVNKLADKFEEEAGDIQQAMNDMRQADQKAGAGFN